MYYTPRPYTGKIHVKYLYSSLSVRSRIFPAWHALVLNVPKCLLEFAIPGASGYKHLSHIQHFGVLTPQQ